MFRLVSLDERILRRADGIGRGSSGAFLASYWIHGTQCAVPLLHQKDARPETIFELIHPLWLSANIAILKDLDFLENRLATLGTGQSSASAPADPNRNQRSRRKVGEGEFRDKRSRVKSRVRAHDRGCRSSVSNFTASYEDPAGSSFVETPKPSQADPDAFSSSSFSPPVSHDSFPDDTFSWKAKLSKSCGSDRVFTVQI